MTRQNGIRFRAAASFELSILLTVLPAEITTNQSSKKRNLEEKSCRHSKYSQHPKPIGWLYVVAI